MVLQRKRQLLLDKIGVELSKTTASSTTLCVLEGAVF